MQLHANCPSAHPCPHARVPLQYALKMQQRPIPRNTVRLCYNEICVSALQQEYSARAAGGCVQRRRCLLLPACLVTPHNGAVVLDAPADPGQHVRVERAHEVRVLVMVCAHAQMAFCSLERRLACSVPADPLLVSNSFVPRRYVISLSRPHAPRPLLRQPHQGVSAHTDSPGDGAGL